MANRLTHLDLCSGIGGFHLAAEWAGFETVGFSEIDPYCCALLQDKWPHIKNYGDLRPAANFEPLQGRVRVLSAGVPCQPASLAGLRRGKSDDRWLWDPTLDVVGSVQPTWTIFENPPGILTLDEFDGVLLRLDSLGYQVRAFSVPANSVGAKHRRARVFIVAHSERLGCDGRANGWREPTGTRSPLESGGTSGARSTAWTAECCEAMADTDSKRFAQRPECNGEQDESGFEASRWNDSERCDQTMAYSEGEQEGEPGKPWELCSFWLTEPPLCGRTDGIPHRSHRLKSLGNAVVPQQAFPFFQAIAEVEHSKEVKQNYRYL